MPARCFDSPPASCASVRIVGKLTVWPSSLASLCSATTTPSRVSVSNATRVRPRASDASRGISTTSLPLAAPQVNSWSTVTSRPSWSASMRPWPLS